MSVSSEVISLVSDARETRERKRERKDFPIVPQFSPERERRESFLLIKASDRAGCERVVKRTRRPTIVVNDAVVFLASIIMMSFLSF